MSPRIGSLRAARAWLSSHAQASDALVVLALLLIGLPQLYLQQADDAYREPTWVTGVVVTVITLGLIMRRRWPLTVLIYITVGELLLTNTQYPSSVADIVAFLIAIYTVAAHRALAHSVLGGLLAFGGFTGMMLLVPVEVSLIGFITNTALLVGVWTLGRNLRLRRAYLAELEHRAARLERARGTDARAARVEERSRIARELHDVVAHHVSVMTVQAGAARRILDKDPTSAREAMTTIEEVGRTALSEMRRIVGVLRTERDAEAAAAPALTPQPGIGDLGELVDHVRETGLAVQLWVEGEARALSPGVDLAAFRLIQEALTNTLKHAGPQARAWVRLNYGDHDLTVEVEDDGRGAATALVDNGDNPGHGLVGMYERVSLYGGELRIGPRIGGGFGVRARFPLEA